MDRSLSMTESLRVMRTCRRTPGAGASLRAGMAALRRAVYGAARTVTVQLALALTVASTAYAAGGDPMPWDGPLTALMNNLAGPTARVLVTIAVVGCGLMWAFTRNDEGLKKLGQIAFGGAIAMGAATLMASLGFAGAVV